MQQLAQDVAAAAGLGGDAEEREKRLMGPHARGPGRLPGARSRTGDLDQRADKVNAGQGRVHRLHKAGVDIDERRALGSQDHVCGQCAVPVQSLAEDVDMRADSGQADTPLVAGATACSLADPLAGVKGHELTVREYRLDHGQWSAGRLLDEHPGMQVQLRGMLPQFGARAYPADSCGCGADRRLYESGQFIDPVKRVRTGDDRSPRLGQAEPGQRLERGDLVLHLRKRGEIRHRSQQPRAGYPVSRQRHDGYLLLNGQQEVSPLLAGHVKRGIQPAQRVAAKTRHAVARQLSVTPMALYRHLDGKQALLDGLVELLLTGSPLPAADAPWPARLTEIAEAVRSTAKAHPAVFPMLLTRPAVTPAARAVRDSVLAALHEAGLAADEAARAERLLSTAVLGFAASEAAGRFRYHAQAVIDEDFAMLLRWLRQAVSPVPPPN